VISDTHDHVPAVMHELLKEADEIWHLGDVCAGCVLEELETIGPPLVVVRGNNDWNSEWPMQITLQRRGLRCFLVHIAPKRAPAGVDVLLHGHTHEPADYMDQAVRWLNPGALYRPRGGSSRGFAWLEIREDGWDWTRVRIGG
jgi:putative phosphoesterase